MGRPVAYADMLDNERHRRPVRREQRCLSDVPCPEPDPRQAVVGSTDMGNISYVVPSIHPIIAGRPAQASRSTRRSSRGTPPAPRATRPCCTGALALAWTVADPGSRRGALEPRGPSSRPRWPAVGPDARRIRDRGRGRGVASASPDSPGKPLEGPNPSPPPPPPPPPLPPPLLPLFFSSLSARDAYISEEFTPDEADVLRRYFTNLDGPVFALVNLPEVVKGALFARYTPQPQEPAPAVPRRVRRRPRHQRRRRPIDATGRPPAGRGALRPGVLRVRRRLRWPSSAACTWPASRRRTCSPRCSSGAG